MTACVSDAWQRIHLGFESDCINEIAKDTPHIRDVHVPQN